MTNSIKHQSGFIQLDRILSRNNALGLEAAALLSVLIDNHSYFDKINALKYGGFFFTGEDMEEYTGMKRKTQAKHINTLKEAGMLTTVNKGIPLRTYYILDFKVIQDTIDRLHSENKFKTKEVKEPTTKREIRSANIKKYNAPVQEVLDGKGEKDITLKKLQTILNKVCKTDNYRVKQYHTTGGYKKALKGLKGAYGSDFVLTEEVAAKACLMYKHYLQSKYTGSEEEAFGKNFTNRFVDDLQDYANPKLKVDNIAKSDNTILL